MAHLSGSAGPESGRWGSALVLLLLSVLSGPASAVSEPGKWIVDVNDVSHLGAESLSASPRQLELRDAAAAATKAAKAAKASWNSPTTCSLAPLQLRHRGRVETTSSGQSATAPQAVCAARRTWQWCPVAHSHWLLSQLLCG